MPNVHKIALWQTAFLGDATLTLPLAEALKARHPDATLHFYVRAGLEPLFQALPYVDETRGFAKRGRQKGLAGLLAQGRQVARERYDLWISAHQSLRSGLIARLSRAGRRIGYDSPWCNRAFYTDVVDRRFGSLAEIERLGRLLLPLGLDLGDATPRLVLPLEAEESAKRIMAEAGGDGPLVGIHPGSVWPTKRWPEEHAATLVKTALGEGARVVLFGAPGEETDLARRVAEAAGPAKADGRLLDLAGRLSLPELAACLKRLDVYVSNDSGPMHLAWVQGVPLVALFGPTTRALGFFPRGPASRVLELPLPCRPCGLHGGKTCPLGTHACLRDLAPGTAWQAVRDALDRHPRPAGPAGEARP